MADHRRLAGHCACGAVQFEVTGRPLLRAFCHCLICQEFNQAAFADVTVFRTRDVALPHDERIQYRVYKQPPLVKRGTCTSCGKPAVERIALPLLPKMTVIPSGNIVEQAALPTPAMHIFYHRRLEDANDDLPKYSGFFKSQSSFTVALLKALA